MAEPGPAKPRVYRHVAPLLDPRPPARPQHALPAVRFVRERLWPVHRRPLAEPQDLTPGPLGTSAPPTTPAALVSTRPVPGPSPLPSPPRVSMVPACPRVSVLRSTCLSPSFTPSVSLSVRAHNNWSGASSWPVRGSGGRWRPGRVRRGRPRRTAGGREGGDGVGARHGPPRWAEAREFIGCRLRL